MRRKESNQETMRTFKDWPLLDEMPDGWRLCGDVGSPLAGYVFIHNGKSVINGQQRALLRAQHPQQALPLPETLTAKPMPEQPPEQPAQQQPEQCTQRLAKTMNDLARKRAEASLLRDIRADLAVCEIEGWSKTEYINQLKASIDRIARGI